MCIRDRALLLIASAAYASGLVGDCVGFVWSAVDSYRVVPRGCLVGHWCAREGAPLGGHRVSFLGFCVGDVEDVNITNLIT